MQDKKATQPMNDDSIAAIAEQVSILMQLDRMRHHVDTRIDMKVLGNVPDYIASVFEENNAIGSALSPEELYKQVNKRISQVQAQLYLLRLEMENRSEQDPARIYDDPLAISAYGERLETITRAAKSFGFEPSVLAFGWHALERSENRVHRWMRPGEVSVACLPHLGTVDQIVEIEGHLLDPEQFGSLTIRAGETLAEIVPEQNTPTRFTARLTLKGEDLKSANYLPVEFVMTDFRQPNAQDTRLLGANISRFTCRPLTEPASGEDSAVSGFEIGDGGAQPADQ
ncbi:hypothetical protein [Salipiger abyssi]|uniref:hypothetical protein n=1 Tax=Salipiger abyssi TaxID=1250539 RepID=UPI001A8D914D|nr:hypothetical protein [Salipiger abyssi]MBN9889824.1 hypothetical protein [Salipiger abyssi]